jgi:predicted site-specific integrase-resolvase
MIPESKNALRPKEFCQRNSVGMTTFYQEVKNGRLKVRKVGKATIIPIEQEREWLESLPVGVSR